MKTSKLLEARENAGDQVLSVLLVLRLIGRKSGASLLDQSQNKVKWNQNNPGLLSTSNW